MEDIIFQLVENLLKYSGKKQVGKYNPLLKGVDGYAANQMGEDVLSIVKKHAKVVSVAAIGNGLPGAGAAIAVSAVVASTWKMYYDINQKLGISFSENFLKSISSGIVSNLASNGVAAVGTNMLSWIPGIGTIGAIAGGMAINRAAIYSAAVAYLKILNTIADKGGDFSESSFNSAMNNSVSTSSASSYDSQAGKYYDAPRRRWVSNNLKWDEKSKRYVFK